MGFFSNLLGTLENMFKIGRGNVDASGLTASRTFSLPDQSGTLALQGGASALSVVSKTGAYTLTNSDDVILADATSAAFTLTLHSAVTATKKEYVIKKIDAALANLITVAAPGAETIDGKTSLTLSQRGDTLVLVPDGANWRIVEESPFDIESYRAKGATLNRWYMSTSGGTALTTGSPTINTLRAIPLVVSKLVTIDQLAINVTTLGTGSNARVGIYTDNGNLYPGALVADCGSISTATTGVKTYATNLPVTLLPGLYWLVIVGDGTAPTIRALNVNSMSPILGLDSGLGTAWGVGWSVAFTFAALPATFPAGGAVLSAAPIPAIFARFAS